MMNDLDLSKIRGIVVGHGIDLVEIADFACLMNKPVCNFLNRNFTIEELEEAGCANNRVNKLAGRFALKEAVMKALGVGWGDGIAFTDVEVCTLASGAPTVILKRKLANLQKERSISGWLVSISHTRNMAIASAVAVSDSPIINNPDFDKK